MKDMSFRGVSFLKRPADLERSDESALADQVAASIREVALGGDEALRRFSRQFDHVELRSIEVTAEDVEVARKACDAQLLEDMRFGIQRVRQFAKAQLETMMELELE